MSRYTSEYVVCPFYNRNKPNRICCEGVDKSNTLNVVFESQTMMHEYVVNYCNSIDNYKSCLLCQMLTKKWEESEMAKYGNIKTVTSDGIKHDSVKEANRWCELKLLEKAGKIKDLRRQVEYELFPAQYETYARYGKKGQRLKDGVRLIERRCCYIADFVYTDVETGKEVVEDTKSDVTKTDVYKIKKKLMLYIHKIKVVEVM